MSSSNGSNGYNCKDNGSNSGNPGEGWSNGDITPTMFPISRKGKLELYSKNRRWIGLTKGWTRISKGSSELDARHSTSASGESMGESRADEAKTVRSLIAQLCEQFYRNGWATGTGGGVSIRVGGPSEGRPFRVFVAPSGIMKEDMIGDDVFELDMDCNIVVPPKTKNLRLSACTPLWYVVYKHRPSARSVIHTHSIYAQMATLLDPSETAETLKITHLEMLKGVGNHAYDDVLEVPIIDNRPSEDLLATQLTRAITKYPKCNAVLVRRHGLYVWGDSWEQAKTQCESFDYLFQSAIEMKRLGIDPGKMPPSGTYRVSDESDQDEMEVDDSNGKAEGQPANKKRKLDETNDAAATGGFHGKGDADNKRDYTDYPTPVFPRDGKILLFDIEGCTTSISFVKDQLFPYVLEHLEAFLKENMTSEQDRAQLAKDLWNDIINLEHPGIDTTDDSKSKDIVWMVQSLMKHDAKVPALKSLQGKMWKLGYDNGSIKGHVYSDFVPMLQWMKSHKVSINIYSSGSVQAQKLLFGNSSEGDLLSYFSNHYDIPTAGNKKQSQSYTKIAQSMNVSPKDICFVSDSIDELKAAKEAGIQHCIMSIRPGNVPLENGSAKQFPSIISLLQLCGE